MLAGFDECRSVGSESVGRHDCLNDWAAEVLMSEQEEDFFNEDEEDAGHDDPFQFIETGPAALKNLEEHIRFLKRCSSNGAIDICGSKDEECSQKDAGLHVGVYATLTTITGFIDRKKVVPSGVPIKRLSSETCPVCLSDLFDKMQPVLFSLPCGHQLHHDCGRTWFLEHNYCPEHDCGLALETEETIAQLQAAASMGDYTKIFDRVEDALREILGEESSSATLEYDGVTIQGSGSAVQSNKGNYCVELTDAMDKFCVISAENEVKEISSVSKLIESFYQGSVIIRIKLRVSGSNHGKQKAPTGKSVKAAPTRVVPAPRDDIEIDHELSSSSISRKSSSKQMLNGVRQQFTRAFQTSILSRSKKENSEVSNEDDETTFTRLYTFVVKSGALFQRSPFSNAIHMVTTTPDSSGDPEPRVIYM